jgi:MYXO-CTERM domain-containing protein
MVTFTANVAAPTPTPTGMVTFFDGSTALGTAPLSTNGTAVISLTTTGNAAFSTSSLTTGSHQITAVYSGDTGFMPSSSAPLANVVADFTNVAKGTTTQNMFPGGSTSYTFLLTPVGASTFLSDTKVSIAGLPPGTTYTFSPAVIPAGSGATTVTLNLTTSKDLSAGSHVPTAPGTSNRSLPIALGMLGLLGIGAVRRRRHQMPRLLMLVLLSVASLLPIAALSGCAGGYFTLTPTTYSLNVTGTEGAIQHTATTTLIVQ